MPRLRLAILAVASILAGCSQAPDCRPEAGFELGRGGSPISDACAAPEYGQAWRLGHSLGQLEAERKALQDRADELEALDQARLRVLERDIPELETLARLRGLLPPATLDHLHH